MKKMFKVVVGAGMGITAAVAIANAVDEFIQRKRREDETNAVEAEDKAAREAIYEFRLFNGLKSEALTYVSESGYTPIFAYDSKFNLEQMRIPKGYTLLKLIQPSGATTYALGKMVDTEFTEYHILAYLVDDWDDEL